MSNTPKYSTSFHRYLEYARIHSNLMCSTLDMPVHACLQRHMFSDISEGFSIASIIILISQWAIDLDAFIHTNTFVRNSRQLYLTCSCRRKYHTTSKAIALSYTTTSMNHYTSFRSFGGILFEDFSSAAQRPISQLLVHRV